MRNTLTLAATLLVATAATTLATAPPSGGNNGNGNGNGGGGGGTTTDPISSGGTTSNSGVQLHVVTPGFTDPRDAVQHDVLLDRIEFADGTVVTHSDFVYPGRVMGLTYNGPVARFRVMNGMFATVGRPGVEYIEVGDYVPESISESDVLGFNDRIGEAFGNNNVNNRVHLETQAGYSFIVSLQTRVWDSHFALDGRPELFILEEQGNSVMTIQALDDNLQNVGTPVEVRAVDVRSIDPAKVWVGRFNQNGGSISGTYEMKVVAIDLTRLGVPHLKNFRLTTAIQGGGEESADVKIIAIDSSPARAAQTMSFD